MKPTSALAAMHRSKLLNLVVLSQDYSRYPTLKSKEIKVLKHIVNELGLKPLSKAYKPDEFLMFKPIKRTAF